MKRPVCWISILYILHVLLALLDEEYVHRCGMYKVRRIGTQLTVREVHSNIPFITNQVCFYTDWLNASGNKATIRRSCYENIQRKVEIIFKVASVLHTLSC
jgi:hypothetical protein